MNLSPNDFKKITRLNKLLVESQRKRTLAAPLPFYYFEIWVTEFKQYKGKKYNNNGALTPQDVIIDLFEGKVSFSSNKLLSFLLNKFENDQSKCISWLANLVTPYEEKNTWVESKNLVKHSKMQLIAKLNIIDMINVLINFPNPQHPPIISKRESITSPYDFILIINDIIDNEMASLLNLYPYIHRKDLYIKPGGFYELCDYIKLGHGVPKS